MLVYLLFFFYFVNSEPWKQAGYDSHGSYRSAYKNSGTTEWTFTGGEGKSGFSYPSQAVIDDKTGTLLVTYADYYDFPSNVSVYLVQLDLADGTRRGEILLASNPKRDPFGVPVVAQMSGVDESIYIISGWTDDPSETVPYYLGFKVSDIGFKLDWTVKLDVDVLSVLWNNAITSDGIFMAEVEEEYDRNQVFGVQYPDTSTLWELGWIMVNRYLSLDGDENVYFFNTSSYVKLDPTTGKILVNKEVDIGEYGIVDGYDRVVFADTLGMSYFIGESNLVRCHDTKTLTQQWETDLTTDINIKCSNPAVTDDEKYLIFVCSGFNTGNSSVYILDTSSGEITYQYPEIGEKNCILLGNQGIAVFSGGDEEQFLVTCQKNLYVFGKGNQMVRKIPIVEDQNSSIDFVTSVVLDETNNIYACFDLKGTFNCKRFVPSSY